MVGNRTTDQLRVTADESRRIMSTIFSNVKLCALIDLTTDAYTIMQDHLLDVNMSWPQNGSYADLAHAIGELVATEQREAYLDFLNRDRLLIMIQSGEKYLEMEHEIIDAVNEKTGRMLSKVYAMERSDGQKVQAILIVRNIDKAAVNYSSRREYETVLKHMPGYACKIMVTENDMILLSASEKYYKFMGAGPELLCGKTLFQGFREKEKQNICSQMREKIQKKADVYYYGHGYKYNGEQFWLVLNGSFFELQNNRPVYYCVITNASHMMEMQDKSKLREKEFRAAASMGERTVFSYDIKERKLHVIACAPSNTWMLEIDGHAPEHLIERERISGIDAIVVYDMFCSIERGLQSGEVPFTMTYQGEQIHISCRFSTVFDDNGNPVSAVISIVDDTFIKRAEAMECFFYKSDDAAKYNKVLIINPQTAQIEYETDNEDTMFMAEGITNFDVAKERLIRGGYVAGEYVDAWKEFLDSGRLLKCYLSGSYEDTFYYRGNNRFGKNRDFAVSVVIRKSEYQYGIRMYIRFEDMTATSLLKEGGYRAKSLENILPHKVQIRTFGHFDVFVDGQPLAFPHEKAKEMLAVLVNRRGGFVTTAEMVSYLWENEPLSKAVQSRCRQVASRLKRILEENDVVGIIETVNGRRRIIPEKVDCDFFHYMNKEPDSEHLFFGSYMTNYGWSEMTLADLENARFSE